MVELYRSSRAEGFGTEVKRRIMLGTYALSSGYYEAFYLKAQKTRALLKADFDRAWEKADIILAPVSPTPPFRIGEKSEDPLTMYLSDIFTLSANLAAIPALALPCGFTEAGLPIGFQIMGPPFCESVLFRFGAFYQALTGHHQRSPTP
jgi:aspartyl-tRNA(Asn)/glutamyl-tRNA(Gln) amidotransferase subunit A